MDEVDRVARSQWGLITYAQLSSLLSRGEIATAMKNKRILPFHRGVHRMAGAPMTWQQRVVAGQLAFRDGAIASHQTAARLLGLAVPLDPRCHLTIGLRKAHVRSDIVLHRADVPDDQLRYAQRICRTSVERTLIDLASVLRQRELAHGLDEAVIARATTYAGVDEVLRSLGSRGRKGAGVLRRLLDERLPLPDGVFSSIHLRVVKAVQGSGLPVSKVEYSVGPYSLDLAWPDLMVGAEADGYAVHTASRVRHTKDRRRRNYLESRGWRILNFTHDMSPREIAEVLRRNIA